MAKPEPSVVMDGPATPRVYAPGTAQPPARPLPQVTGSIPPATAAPPPAALGSTDRVITIIDGTSGARREVRIPATSETADPPPLPDPGLTDILRTTPDTDEAQELSAQPPPQPSRAKANAPQKRAAKPGASTSTNSTSQVPVR